MATKKTTKLYFLIGPALEKLPILRVPPTLRHLLQNLVYHHLENGETIKNSASLVIKNAIVLWNELNLKTQRRDKCEQKLIKIYDEWCTIVKNENSETISQKTIRKEFSERLDKAFDVISPTKITPSTSKEVMTSEGTFYDEMLMDIDSEINENLPDTSGQSSPGITKRSSTIMTDESIEEIHDEAEEGKNQMGC